MSDWPYEADKTALVNRKTWLDHWITIPEMWVVGGRDVLRDQRHQLEKVTAQLDLLNRKVELYKMTTQVDQLGTEAPLTLCICNEFIKDEFDEVTAQLSELGPIGEDPGPLPAGEKWGTLSCIYLVLMVYARCIAPCIALWFLRETIKFCYESHPHDLTVTSVPVQSTDMHGEVPARHSDVHIIGDWYISLLDMFLYNLLP
jgi:hypothetical protein